MPHHNKPVYTPWNPEPGWTYDCTTDQFLPADSNKVDTALRMSLEKNSDGAYVIACWMGKRDAVLSYPADPKADPKPEVKLQRASRGEPNVNPVYRPAEKSAISPSLHYVKKFVYNFAKTTGQRDMQKAFQAISENQDEAEAAWKVRAGRLRGGEKMEPDIQAWLKAWRKQYKGC